jgi:hypothetical protein
MSKETVIAILLGLGVGILLVGGIYTAKKALETKQTSMISANTRPSLLTVTTGNPNQSGGPPLSLLRPLDLTLTAQNKISVEGKTDSTAFIVLQTEMTTDVFQPDNGGKFSQDILLSGGSNDITVSAVGTGGQITSKTVTVVYSTAL